MIGLLLTNYQAISPNNVPINNILFLDDSNRDKFTIIKIVFINTLRPC